jgi:hypothetical protein
MNNNQTLLNIADLRLAIRIKEFQYNEALNNNDELRMRSDYKELLLLKEAFNAETEALNIIDNGGK